MKLCPFCGSSAVGPGYRTHPDGHDLTMISCSNCGANGPVRPYSNEWDDEEAATGWDTRRGDHIVSDKAA